MIVQHIFDRILVINASIYPLIDKFRFSFPLAFPGKGICMWLLWYIYILVLFCYYFQAFFDYFTWDQLWKLGCAEINIFCFTVVVTQIIWKIEGHSNIFAPNYRLDSLSNSDLSLGWPWLTNSTHLLTLLSDLDYEKDTLLFIAILNTLIIFIAFNQLPTLPKI